MEGGVHVAEATDAPVNCDHCLRRQAPWAQPATGCTSQPVRAEVAPELVPQSGAPTCLLVQWLGGRQEWAGLVG